MAVHAHSDIVLAEKRRERLQDVSTDLILVFLLQLQLEGGGIAVGIFVGGGVGVAHRVGDDHRADLQPLHGVGDQISDGLGLLVRQLRRAVHGHLHRGRGIHHVSAVQHVATVLAPGDEHLGVLHIVEIANDVADALL